jgi:hypothetical protein
MFKYLKSDFLRAATFKLLIPIKGYSIKDCSFLKVIISVGGGHCDYLPQAPKILAGQNTDCAMTLYVNNLLLHLESQSSSVIM